MKISDLARDYASGYVRCLAEMGISASSKDAFLLFKYTMGTLYGVRSARLTPFIVEYYIDCRIWLQRIKDEFEIKNEIYSYDDELIDAIIEYSCIYALIAIQYCSGSRRVGSRIF